MLAAVATHQSYVSEETRIMALVQKGFKTVYLLLWVVIQRFYCPKMGAWEKLRATDYFDMTMLLNWWKEAMKLYIIVDVSSLKVHKQAVSIAQSITTRGCQKTKWSLTEIWWNVFNLKALVFALEVNKGPSHNKGNWLPLHINHKSFCAFMTL